MVGKEAGLEYKTASAYSSGKWKDGEISPHVDQIQTNDKQTKSGVIDAFMDLFTERKHSSVEKAYSAPWKWALEWSPPLWAGIRIRVWKKILRPLAGYGLLLSNTLRSTGSESQLKTVQCCLEESSGPEA